MGREEGGKRDRSGEGKGEGEHEWSGRQNWDKDRDGQRWRAMKEIPGQREPLWN